MLIGNLTRDPELKYTPSGAGVCTFGIATNRNWTTDTGEKKDDVDFHNIVAWNKLAEICSQLLKKGRKVYVEGRLSTRTWQAQDGTNRTRTEVVISDMLILDKKEGGIDMVPDIDMDQSQVATEPKESKKKEEEKEINQEDEDIPF